MVKLMQEQNVNLANDGLDRQILPEEQPSSAGSGSLSEPPVHHSVTLGETVINNGTGKTLPEALLPTGQTNITPAVKIPEPALIDERSLLACIVRTIPAGGRIRINSTVRNLVVKILVSSIEQAYSSRTEMKSLVLLDCSCRTG